MRKGINVLSLFDGMSCGRIALDRSGIGVNKYYASEIDKHAITVSKDNWDNEHLGDVTRWREWGIEWASIDLILAGSPCQGFSFAGKQLAFDDPRSSLFFVFIDILNHVRSVNPGVKFLLENVRMKKEHLTVISNMTGVDPVFINSALVSAQNRQRYYWCNWDIEQPEDKGILLADIVDYGVVDRDKSYCIDANYWKGGDLKQYFEKHRRQLVFIEQRGRGNNPGGIRAVDGKTPCLPTSHWQQNNKLVVSTSERGRRLNQEGTRNDKNGQIERGYEIRTDGKSGALTTVLKDNYLTENYTIRKLTPVECERLQTVPDGYTQAVSNTQRYKMLGNGWTVDVIKHILDSSGLHDY